MSISLRTLLLCALSGCAPPPAAPDAGTARDAELTDASLDAGCASPDILDCIDTTPDPTCAGTWLAAVRGRLVDDSGGPVANARAQLCVRLSPDDRLVCLDLIPEAKSSGK